MNICTNHSSDIFYKVETCPACQYIDTLNKIIIAYESELADYERTVTRLNAENKGLQDNGDKRTCDVTPVLFGHYGVSDLCRHCEVSHACATLTKKRGLALDRFDKDEDE